MSPIARSFGPALAALLCVFALSAAPGARAAVPAAAEPPAVDPMVITPSDMTLGNPKAKVTVIEYASVTCPHCAAFNAEVFPAFKAKYVDTGKVFYVFREFPTEPQDLAAAGFMIARCAPAGSYFAVIDNLFKGQTNLFKTSDTKTFLLDAGKVGGLDEAKIGQCLHDQAALDAFSGRVRSAITDARIEGTPTFLVGKAKLVGEQTLAQLDAAIEAASR